MSVVDSLEGDDFHPYDPRAAAEPFAALTGLRATCPVSRPSFGELPPALLFTKYDDVAQILRDRQRFSNIGMALSREHAEAVPMDERIHTMLNPPRHADVRRLLLAAIAPKIVKRVGPRLEQLAAQVVGDFAGLGQSDLVVDWAGRLPAIIIASVLGLPESDADRIHEWVHAMFSESVLDQEEFRRKGPANHSAMDDSFSGYLAEQIELRRGDGNPNPDDDGLRRMVECADSMGTRFSDRELRVHIHSLLVAANETTTGLMSNLIYQILVRGLFDEVKADRTRIAGLIDESLRIDSPIQMTVRLCEEDTVVGGVTVRKDEVVIVSIASANRDEDIWGRDSEQFRDHPSAPGRGPAHIAFGLGVHNCPGAALARLTAEIGLNALLDQTEDMRLATGYRYDNVYFFMVRRPKRVDVEFTPSVSVEVG